MKCPLPTASFVLQLLLAACEPSTAGKPELTPPPASAHPSENKLEVPAPERPPAEGPLRFLVIGGGPTPENTEVSLEQDVDLAREALPGPGLVLFAGGGASPSVRELDPTPRGDPVRTALGDLFSPRSGRRSRYRPPRFAAERATLENVEARLGAALAQSQAPLSVYIAAHGDQGNEPRNNSVALWGGGSLSVARLAELHEQHRRPLRLVATSCFSGGFAELAFARAAPGAGPSRVRRCGLFAGTADRETSGCDPNPNRRAQESHALHFLHALSGTRPDGTPLPRAAVDYDRDGKLGMLDAHTWARIRAVSFDVPTTTSERWLRAVERGSAPIDASAVPEDLAVVEQLGAELRLKSERAVQKRWAELDRQLSALHAELDAAEAALASIEAVQGTLLLEQWPVLDDPFHPDFEGTFAQHRGAIESLLSASPDARTRSGALRRLDALYEQLGRLGVEEARVARVLRAYETLHKASALLKRGGPEAKYYSSLLDCERAPPGAWQ